MLLLNNFFLNNTICTRTHAHTHTRTHAHTHTRGHAHTPKRCLAKASNPGESGMADDYDYMEEGRSYAQKFAAQLALPETAELMATLRAALETTAAVGGGGGGGMPSTGGNQSQAKQ